MIFGFKIKLCKVIKTIRKSYYSFERYLTIKIKLER
jgi:hypothetical protein